MVNKFEIEKAILENDINENLSQINKCKNQIKEKITHKKNDALKKLNNSIKIYKSNLIKIDTKKKKMT